MFPVIAGSPPTAWVMRPPLRSGARETLVVSGEQVVGVYAVILVGKGCACARSVAPGQLKAFVCRPDLLHVNRAIEVSVAKGAACLTDRIAAPIALNH